MSAGETLWGVAGAAGGALLLSYALIVRSFVAPDGAATTSRADQARVMWGRWASERRPVFWLAWTVGTLVTASMYLVLLAAAAEDPGLKDFLVFGLFPLPAMLWSYGVLKADAAVANTAVVLTAAASMTLLLTVDGRRRDRVPAEMQWFAAAWIVAHHVVIDVVWWAPSSAGAGGGGGKDGALAAALFGPSRSARRPADETKLEIAAAWALFALSWVPVAVSLARARMHSGREPTATEPGTGEMPVTVVYYFALIVLLFAAFGLVYMRYQYPASWFARSAGALEARTCRAAAAAGDDDGSDAWRTLHSIAGCVHYTAVFALFAWGTIKADYDGHKYLFPVRGFTLDDATWTYRCRTGNVTCGDEDRLYSLKDRNESYPLLHLAALYALWSGTVHLAAALDLGGLERRRWKWIDYFVSAPLMLSVVAVTFGHFGLVGVVLAPLVLLVALVLAARNETVDRGAGASPREKAYLGLSMVTKLTLHTFLLLTVIALGLSLDGSSADNMERIGIGYGAAVAFALLAGVLLATTKPVRSAPGGTTAATAAAAMAYAAFG